MLVAQVAVFFEGFADDALEFGGQIRIETNGRDRLATHDGFEDDGRTFAAERELASGHFIENDAEGEEVAARVELFGANLFGRHISDGANGAAGTGEVLGVNALGSHGFDTGRRRGATSGSEFGQTEIENFGVAALGHENVCWLDVAMNNALRVRGIESVRNVDANVEQNFDV